MSTIDIAKIYELAGKLVEQQLPSYDLKRIREIKFSRKYRHGLKVSELEIRNAVKSFYLSYSKHAANARTHQSLVINPTILAQLRYELQHACNNWMLYNYIHQHFGTKSSEKIRREVNRTATLLRTGKMRNLFHQKGIDRKHLELRDKFMGPAFALIDLGSHGGSIYLSSRIYFLPKQGIHFLKSIERIFILRVSHLFQFHDKNLDRNNVATTFALMVFLNLVDKQKCKFEQTRELVKVNLLRVQHPEAISLSFIYDQLSFLKTRGAPSETAQFTTNCSINLKSLISTEETFTEFLFSELIDPEQYLDALNEKW